MKKHEIILIPNLTVWICLLILSFCRINNLTAQQTSPADNLNATHYDIHITNIDFQAKSIAGITTVTITPLGGEVSAINLELVRLTASAVWLNGSPVTDFTQTDSLVTIIPSSPLLPSDTAIVSIHYSGIPFHEAWGGFHFSGEYAFNLGVGFVSLPHNLGKTWFPCVDNFTDRATYDISCTLPEGKMAICGGELVGQVDNGNGTTTWHWSLDREIPTYLASLAAGSYICVSDTIAGMNGEIPVDVYARPQDTNKVAGSFINIGEITNIFEECMGPYAWNRVGYTSCAIGSMEHATNIFIPHSFISGNTANEATIAHELAHMWMGDMVTCSSAEEMWINEGWATFFGMYYKLAMNGNEEAYKQEMRAKHGGVLQYCHTPSGDGSYFPLNMIPQEYTYGMAAYDKGSTVCQALRFYLGDSLFFGALTDFINDFAFNDADSYDMRDAMSEYSGIDLGGFFDNFVMNSGTPHYSIDSFAVGSNGKDLFDVTVFVKQKRKGPAFTGNGNVMEVMFMDENWNKFTDTVHFNGNTGVSVKMVPFVPTVILVDPEEKMCDATTDNYKTIKTTGTFTFDKTFFSLEVAEVADSAFIQVTHNWAAPDSLKEPVPGLRLSDYRYWRIDGIFPEGFSASGKFTYSALNYLDNTLLTSSGDTLVILYRPGAREDWQEIAFVKTGPWNVGNLTVENIQPGEYTLAVKEAGVGSYEPDLPKKNAIEIYPNPSSGEFIISLNEKNITEFRIYSTTGSLVKSITINKGKDKISWLPGEIPAGIYYGIPVTENNDLSEARKLFYVK